MGSDPIEEVLRAEASRFAAVLAEGAAATHAGMPPFEVRFVKLPKWADWSGKQMTLSNHITKGAYAMVKQADGSRWVYTTSQGRAQIATLQRWSVGKLVLFRADTFEELRDELGESLVTAMTNGTQDRRSRRVTARGFDFDDAEADREQFARFDAWADGVGDPIAERDLEAFLRWWDGIVDLRVKRAVGGLPVDRDVYEMSGRHGLVEKFELVSRG